MKPIKGFLFDLDGVLYVEDQIIPGAVAAVNWLRRQGSQFRFLTNTTILSRDSLVAKLSRFGIQAEPGEMFSTALVAMIGDDIHMDFIGAQAVGMPTILVRTGKYAFDVQQPLPVQPDWVINSIADLPGLIGDSDA